MRHHKTSGRTGTLVCHEKVSFEKVSFVPANVAAACPTRHASIPLSWGGCHSPGCTLGPGQRRRCNLFIDLGPQPQLGA